ncbi:MAG TPA: M15 family metallopeptidase [Candidatus Copromonas faecavium]|uniref:M15 family metallopeptidase n=1 Tax=Candidatus Copromonas faecavium (nom. illeg.) TaxID=2840740 RepID=A0A9D1D754_9FIRM|nr:M15 family metallopeptidase [Candidatus Copromonas faecavium]
MDTYQKVEEQFSRIAENPSAEMAAQEMVWVEIPVWRLVNGQKVADTDRVQVLSSIADEVKAIFTEIYNGPEQFPINSIGGYSWRSNGLNSYHSSGLAIDINPDQNPQVREDGTVLVGSKWEPGVNPYSISQDSDVVKAFGKYGWNWGAAFTTKDYMHFEY